MENQALSSSSSSTPKPEKLKSHIVAIDESKEKATRNNNLKLGSPQDVTSERRVEIPRFGSGPIRRGSENMNFNPPQPTQRYTCYFCQKWFFGSHEFVGHRNAHREWEKKREEMEAYFTGLPQDVTSERRVEIPSFGSSPVQSGSEIMKSYLPKTNKLYTCNFCQKWFNGSHAFVDHQNDHKQMWEWEKKRMQMEVQFPGVAFLNPYLDMPHILSCGYSQVTGNNPNRFVTGNTSTNGFSSMGPVPFPSNNNMYPLIPRNVLPFPPPRTSGDLVPQENVLSEENLILKLGMNNDEDQPEERDYKSWGKDLSLSL
ncbi:hypothetical protein V5N11_019101 [Cardamine amara subsp. amara]|uniref:C2H2-type domain-containing protein n=1 Tax=Cardamine amara subsp. amara TaxID=228776 RepID=A0ABD0ZY65_CARAN